MQTGWGLGYDWRLENRGGRQGSKVMIPVFLFYFFNKGTTSFSLLLPTDGWQGSRLLCSVGIDLVTTQTIPQRNTLISHQQACLTLFCHRNSSLGSAVAQTGWLTPTTHLSSISARVAIVWKGHWNPKWLFHADSAALEKFCQSQINLKKPQTKNKSTNNIVVKLMAKEEPLCWYCEALLSARMLAWLNATSGDSFWKRVFW